MAGIREELGKYLQSRSEYAGELLCELIGFRSTMGCEQSVQEFLHRHVSDLGLAPKLVPIDDDIGADPDYTCVPGHTTYRGRPNIVIDVAGRGGGRSAIVNSHCDVVPAPDELYAASFQDGVVHGRGACDAKGQVVTMLVALRAMRATGLDLKGDLQAQMVIEEEAGGNGSLSLIRQGHRADAVVVLEPTSLRMHPANRGAVWYKLGVKGKSAHMGRYWEGVSAIQEMVGLIGVLKEYEAKLREDSKGNPLFGHEPSPVNVNIGQIQGGDWPATVAGGMLHRRRHRVSAEQADQTDIRRSARPDPKQGIRLGEGACCIRVRKAA